MRGPAVSIAAGTTAVSLRLLTNVVARFVPSSRTTEVPLTKPLPMTVSVCGLAVAAVVRVELTVTSGGSAAAGTIVLAAHL